MTTKKTNIIDNLCYLMFCQNKQKIEMLPPATDCLFQHLEHSNYQAFGWSHALEAMQDLGSQEGHGWVHMADDEACSNPHGLTCISDSEESNEESSFEEEP